MDIFKKIFSNGFGRGLLIFAVGLFAGIGYRMGFGWRYVAANFMQHPAPTPLSCVPNFTNDTTFCILSLGQSNAANHGVPRARAGANVWAHHAGLWYPAIDPLPGASGEGGSVWTRLAPRFLKYHNVDSVVFASVAQGSSNVGDWLANGIHYLKLKCAIAGLHNDGVVIDAVIWHQGENEGWNNNVSGNAYASDLHEVIAGIRRLGVEAPIFVCLATRDSSGVVNTTIRFAQSSTWSRTNNVYAGADTDCLGDLFRSDGVHFNQLGLETFSRLLYESICARSVTYATNLPAESTLAE